MKKDINYRIEQYIGILSAKKSGWNKEVNLVSWNGKKPQLDIRTWSMDHLIMSKGITLTTSEAKKLVDILQDFLSHSKSAK